MISIFLATRLGSTATLRSNDFVTLSFLSIIMLFSIVTCAPSRRCPPTCRVAAAPTSRAGRRPPRKSRTGSPRGTRRPGGMIPYCYRIRVHIHSVFKIIVLVGSEFSGLAPFCYYYYFRSMTSHFLFFFLAQ